MSRKEYCKKYRAEHAEHISEYQRKYREENGDTLKDKKLESYHLHKGKYLEHHVCECGGKYASKNKLRHERCAKHQKFITSNADL